MFEEFNWIINETQQWPPQMKPKQPFGVVTLHTLKTCSLKACFEASHSNYLGRKPFSARVGSAYHRTMEFISESFTSEKPQLVTVTRAINFFQNEMENERAKKACNPRETRLLEEENRIELAILAIIEEIHRVQEIDNNQSKFRKIETLHVKSPSEDISKSGLVEVPVISQDGLIVGRIDRVELTEEGTCLIDFKLAMSDEVPDQYQRQLQLYAYLWYQSCGEWPVEARLINSLTGNEHLIEINPEICLKVVKDYYRVMTRLEKEIKLEKLANPGETCRFCEFRPWCKPFWSWQAGEIEPKLALERAYWGFEGTITNLVLFNGYWKVQLEWRDLIVNLTVNADRFPQFRHAKRGSLVRLLEAKLHGNPFRPQAQIRESSEIFIVEE